jgi:hypothetical protein
VVLFRRVLSHSLSESITQLAFRSAPGARRWSCRQRVSRGRPVAAGRAMPLLLRLDEPLPFDLEALIRRARQLQGQLDYGLPPAR